ncbi:Serine/threonine-protein kinase HT1 [Leucoagaricus sp. SymC.cos]|nr:Serine/threonine-protein kinase HT1 [Leucoagaricus sp. SymC.cos]
MTAVRKLAPRRPWDLKTLRSRIKDRVLSSTLFKSFKSDSKSKPNASSLSVDHPPRSPQLPLARELTAHSQNTFQPPPYIFETTSDAVHLEDEEVENTTPSMTGPNMIYRHSSYPSGSLEEQFFASQESLPPFPDTVNEIVDLIRMAASLLYREMQLVLMSETQSGKFPPYRADTWARLGQLHRLIGSWPDSSFSAMDGIQSFKGSLNDGTILCEFLHRLSPVAHPVPYYGPDRFAWAVNLQKFIVTCERFELSGSSQSLSIGNPTFDELNIQEIASYARAIIGLQERFGETAASLLPRPSGSRSARNSVASLTSRLRYSSLESLTSLRASARPQSQRLEPRSLVSIEEIDDITPDEAEDVSDMTIDDTATNRPPSESHPDLSLPPPGFLSVHQTSQLAPEPIIELPKETKLLYKCLLHIMEDEERYQTMLDVKGTDAQELLDFFQHLLGHAQITGRSRNDILTALILLSARAGLYPSCFTLKLSDLETDKTPLASGHFGDIMRGTCEGQRLCIKVIKLYKKSHINAALKVFLKEAILWSQLQHSNLLPFYGVYRLDDCYGRICLVSPWMDNGTVVEYLRINHEANRLLLIRDIAHGLEFLHGVKIVHGDLKGANILVTDAGRACLADFGLATLNDVEAVKFAILESSGHRGGTPRWEAPELLDDSEAVIHRTPASDVYAFGCVCYEVLTGKLPFYELPNDFMVYVKVAKGERPSKPSDDSWSLPDGCSVDESLRQLQPLRRLSIDESISPTSRPSSPRLFVADGVHVFETSDTQVPTHAYDIYDPENDCHVPNIIIFAANEDWSEEASELLELGVAAQEISGYLDSCKLSPQPEEPHPWATPAINPLLDNNISEVEVIESWANQGKVRDVFLGEYNSPLLEDSETSESDNIGPGISFLEFDGELVVYRSADRTTSALKQKKPNPLPPCPPSTPSPQPENDLASTIEHEQMQVENLLDEMMNECFRDLPMSAFPLQAPGLDPELIASLNLPTIRPLALTTADKRPRVRNDISTVLNEYFENQWRFRPLPTTADELPERTHSCPPPYLTSTAESGQMLSPVDSPEAPPPFPEHVTEIVDLVRMAATLLRREVQAAVHAENGQGCIDDRISFHLETLERLATSWPDTIFSAADGIKAFRIALQDELVLDRFISHLLRQNFGETVAISQMDDTRDLIQAYAGLDHPQDDNLKRLSDVTITYEDLAAYARAIIQIHGRLGWTPLYENSIKSDSNHPNTPIIKLASEAAYLTSESLKDPVSLASTSSVSTGSVACHLPSDEAVVYLRLISIIRDGGNFCKLLFEDDKAEVQRFIDLTQHISGIARSELMIVLIRLSVATSLYPRAFILNHDPQVNKEPVTCGYYGDILRGYIEEQSVCVKVVKIYRKGTTSSKYLKSFMREIVIWGQLEHPNILPFYGVYHLDNAEERICLVSPWMENGTLVDYLKSCSPEVERLLLVRDVASGLGYMHDQMIVHGDLKGVNVLVTLCGRACLADFGLASVNDTDAVRFSTLESTGHQGATPRYEAPELLVDCEEKLHRTTFSDMYAFGGVCYEILTGNVPFYEVCAAYTVMAKVMKGETPTKPAGVDQNTSQLTDEVWALMDSCWSYVPGDRPSASQRTSKFGHRLDMDRL